MREHKYRAWDTVKKVMYSAEELGADQETLSVDGRGFVNVSGDNTRLSQFHTHLLPLEYTGLKDKNGKEIYEGDIIQKEGYAGKMITEPIEYITREDYSNWNFSYTLDEYCDVPSEEWEVVGNIYEDKELLNV